MTAIDIQRLLLDRWNIRIEPEMGRYIVRSLAAARETSGGSISLIGGDARTGRPVRTILSTGSLQAAGAAYAIS